MLPLYPTPNPNASDAKAATVPPAPAADDASAPRPIGPERLRALREAILNGTYPSESAVTEGLSSLFRGSAPRAGDSPPPSPESS